MKKLYLLKNSEKRKRRVYKMLLRAENEERYKRLIEEGKKPNEDKNS